MPDNILAKFDELFKNTDALNSSQLEAFVHEVLKFFETLRTTLVSGTPEEKKEAMQMATTLQKKLEELAQKAIQRSGLTPDQLKSFLSNPHNFSPDEWASFQNADKEITDYKEKVPGVHPAQAPKNKTPKKKKSVSPDSWRKI